MSPEGSLYLSLALRNPDDRPARFAIDLAKLFELPQGAPQHYTLKSPWKSEASKPALELTAGKEHPLELRPFELLVLEATP